MNPCEIGLFALVWGVSKVPWDNYHEILVKIMFYVQNILIYMNLGGYGGDIHISPYIFHLLFKKTQKVQEHDLY